LISRPSNDIKMSMDNELHDRAEKPKIVITDKDYQAALAKIEIEPLSDPEDAGFEAERDRYHAKMSQKHMAVTEAETTKRKRRQVSSVTKYAESFASQSNTAKERYAAMYEQAAADQVARIDAEENKERKKVQQRNRRREGQKARAEQKATELKQQAQETEDRAAREKLLNAAALAEKRAAITEIKLQHGDLPWKELKEVVPLAPNMAGGIMGQFGVDDDLGQEPARKKLKTGNGRLKKSKEQKQAEIDAAVAAQAAIDRGEDPNVALHLYEHDQVRRSTRIEMEMPETRESTPVMVTERGPLHETKAYDTMYESIWREISRKDVPRLVKIKSTSIDIKQTNARKTAQLAGKEGRRWQMRTTKSVKETQARAKRIMREMMSFWKRNERDERDQRKLAERMELENAKKAEAEREANRQKRKLNFLISQTELFSHFIGKKVRTDEIERSTDDVAPTSQIIKAAKPDAHAVELPQSNANLKAKVTKFESLDFDAEDESALQEAAMANAQNAIQEAQNRAKAFDAEQQGQSDFDEGEMNFQNPSSLGNLDLEQPKLLSCTLKEYQLKGLNWLVNLYEQGINGILADEMGLGKTVQSISVMAYLAENHNIWGPFLVIAPASTLHNWQQEIAKFVPTLKTLPYWGSAKDRKILRKFWDRKHITYTKDSPFHVLVTSYQLVVQDAAYFQKIKWQYMILDEAQAIKSSNSSRWKALLGFHCRNRLLLTGTPIQNNMQELWALLHFIMPSLFDSHDEFNEWFSKDIENHAQSNSKLNEDQLKRLHMILKPFMLRRIKKHVQKELGDKIEEDVYCDLTYRQRAIYTKLRDKISIMDLIEKVAHGDDQDTATLMNLVMQFRKVCNHPDLFERADVTSPVSFSYFAETASFLREGSNVDVRYSVRNLIEYKLPRLLARDGGRLDVAGTDNQAAGWRRHFLHNKLNIFSPENLCQRAQSKSAFSWLSFVGTSIGELSALAHEDVFQRAVHMRHRPAIPLLDVSDNDAEFKFDRPIASMLNIVTKQDVLNTATLIGSGSGPLHELMNISTNAFVRDGLNVIESCARPAASAPPIEVHASSQGAVRETRATYFNIPMRQSLYGLSLPTELALLEAKVEPSNFPCTSMLPRPISEKSRYTQIGVPSMRRFVTDSGKLAKLDQLLTQLKEGGHRVLLYFQMTRMIDLMEEYLTYRNYKYCRLDGSTKIEDRRDMVADFQSDPTIFIFLLSTRAGGLGINLTSADTVIFYDSDWNPTIDSQAMDRAHRLGQTRQVTVYRLITRGTIEERIRKRALQKEEVQRVVMTGGAPGGVDFNARSTGNRTKDIAMWLADDDQAEMIERREAELAEKEAKEPAKKKKSAIKKKAEVSLDDMYHEGECRVEDG
jgi:DNA helicase INO80